MDHRFFNRELSWLAFNHRVLGEAARPGLPLLERCKFLAITSANLDEFFMIRVGGLQVFADQGRRDHDDSGLTAAQQLPLIREQVLQLIERQYEILDQQLRPELEQHGIRRLQPEDLTSSQARHIEEYFVDQLLPLLSPIAIDPDHLNLSIPAMQLGLLVKVKPPADAKPVASGAKPPRRSKRARTAEAGPASRFVAIFLPESLGRHVTVPDEQPGYTYLNVEDVVRHCLRWFFPGETILATGVFRISRNGDIGVDDDGVLDLADEMEDVLDARKHSATVRLEIGPGVTKELTTAMRRIADAGSRQIYHIPGELDLRSYFHIAGLPMFDTLKVAPWLPQPSQHLAAGENIFDAIKRADLLLHHPYETFDPVLQLIEEAAADPDVLAIKQILYRTAKNSRIISALINAAESGKHVTVLVELKARFDEARNLERAGELQRAGAQIIYGVRGLKTHAKCLLIVRSEQGSIRRYVHFGTGNYNEATARIYTDISYLTARPEYGADASAFFNTVTGLSQFTQFRKIAMAPYTLRQRLLDLIASEAGRASQGEQAEITLKMNSLQDREMIEALYQASAAGVRIRINVRGICCLVPGEKGLSERIEVVSIIDRYLEHARIYHFHQGGNPVVFISSADWMFRNLSRRVELLVPVEDPDCRRELLDILEQPFLDNAQAHRLQPDGTYLALKPKGRQKPVRSQELFTRRAGKRAKARNEEPAMLSPHLPRS